AAIDPVPKPLQSRSPSHQNSLPSPRTVNDVDMERQQPPAHVQARTVAHPISHFLKKSLIVGSTPKGLTAGSIVTRSCPQCARGTIGDQQPVRAYGASAAIASNSLPNFPRLCCGERELCCHEPGNCPDHCR